MTDQERLDRMDELAEAHGNLMAGLTEDGKPEKNPTAGNRGSK